MAIVLAAPSSTPPSQSERDRLVMSWTGWDGTVVDIGSIMAPGVKGLHMPAMRRHTSSSPLVPGVEVVGYSIPERNVYWPLNFVASSADEWRAEHAAFFGSVHPLKPGVWTFGEGESARSIELVGTFDGMASFELDPFIFGYALIGVELMAPRPLWRGRPISETFGAADGVDFIPPALAPTFHISAAATFSSAQIRNPGDEPAYLTWTVEGPLDTVQVGVGGAVIDVPFEVPAGSSLVIDTDPAGQYATLDGVDCTRQLGFQMFAPVPAKGQTPLTIIAGGAGSVTAALTPLFWRAF